MMKDAVLSQCLLFFLRNGLWRGNGSDVAAKKMENGRVVGLRNHENAVNSNKEIVVASQERSLRCVDDRKFRT